ncbi:hypothetical protein TBLA_0F01970 [Henningerozyma blattae CBS 6284]|uniref:D-lactate ferricytochrome C oxidoreductase n=1 Tax=Henningerozyma blattae (strain ATCC 34711 / CBS 6284 / DSM 70876 / NBRC 10599 / NRRL Y-10934 / UCD 77-7) TaxID=1071380 RepID=I2H5T7_HENB6|nr:hypothetical protein TBLA_0F01970 [Tetrapisispora blattae CBS 6284]CCH61739.1 hypothetical protein TBLA_0F01970 [Tetrapisispora blattae CBS 6284]
MRRASFQRFLSSSGKRFLSQKIIPFTFEKYPNVKRNPNFKSIDSQDIAFFQSILPSPQSILQSDLDEFNIDWMYKFKGQSQLVLKPTSTIQVSQILKYCNEKNLALVPQGGNTGLVGGGVPIFDEIVLSLKNFNKIRSFDEINGILKCDPGIILQDAQEFLASKGYIFPIDLGAKGSCQIGGMVGTNAGGLRLLRYGPLHGSILGLEVVLPDGTIIDGMHSLRKDNTGYDYKQLFIGSEGTLGVVTGISVATPIKSNSVQVAFMGIKDYSSAMKLYVKAKQDLGEILSAFEFMDGQSQEFVKKYRSTTSPSITFPLEESYPYYILIETSGSNKDHDQSKMETFLETAMENELIEDGTIAQDSNEAHELWNWRELIPESCQLNGGSVYKYDISLPIRDMYSLIEETNKRLQEQSLIADSSSSPSSSSSSSSKPVIGAVGFGHMGDGNIHLNIATKQYSKEVESVLEPFVYEFVSSKNGSISAEHGIGFQKKPYLTYGRSKEEIQLNRQIKNLFDPKGIMNPYKLL